MSFSDNFERSSLLWAGLSIASRKNGAKQMRNKNFFIGSLQFVKKELLRHNYKEKFINMEFYAPNNF